MEKNVERNIADNRVISTVIFFMLAISIVFFVSFRNTTAVKLKELEYRIKANEDNISCTPANNCSRIIIEEYQKERKN